MRSRRQPEETCRSDVRPQPAPARSVARSCGAPAPLSFLSTSSGREESFGRETDLAAVHRGVFGHTAYNPVGGMLFNVRKQGIPLLHEPGHTVGLTDSLDS